MSLYIHISNQNADRAVENAVHEASEARRRVDELEDRLREDRRFEPIADMLDKVREEKLAPAQERLESAQFDEVSRRADALEAAAAEMREAMEALQKMDAPIRERVQKLENLEKTRDLAARQEALARAAEDIVREQPTDANKLEAWKRMETAAAMQANDLARKVPDGDLDSARRKMSKAAELMDELKRRMQTAAAQARAEDLREQADTPADCRGSAVGAKAAEAAEAMRREAARQAKALGMPEEQQSSGQSQGEMESRGQSGEESRSGGGGVAAEISKLARELERHDDPEAARQLLERLGWFKIKGAAKDGLGERDLKDIPAEYRELVRSYFLKLAE